MKNNHPKDFQERIDAIMEIDDLGPSFPGITPPKIGGGQIQLDRIETKLDLILNHLGITPSRKIG
jgi:hypothetical protein